MDNDEFWKRKLMAFLHDPPCKPLDFSKTHVEIAKTFMTTCGIDSSEGVENLLEKYFHPKDNAQDSPDHAASAADRMIFPRGKIMKTKFKGIFKHPLSGKELNLHVMQLGEAIGHLQNAFGGIKATSWKDFFFLLWRQWRNNTAKTARDMVYYPAETRLPDHSIWLHMDVTSAMEGCRNIENEKLEPAFLLFQVGPVQEFIANAKSTRDLWSGSYLLAWLVCHALKAVSDLCGADAIIFPSLRGQGIFDAVNKEIFENIKYKSGDDKEMESLWQRLYSSENASESVKHLLNPTIPNRFMALVPAQEAEDIAIKAEEALRKELECISESCLREFAKIAGASLAPWKDRWRKQVEFFPQITWQTMPFYPSVAEAFEAGSKLPQTEILKTFQKIATEFIDKSDRDFRNYIDTEKSKLKRSEFVWAINASEVSETLAARRNTRDFKQFITDANQCGSPKDKISGKDEIIGDDKLWEKIQQQNAAFKAQDGPYGAMTIIKRLWCRTESNYLLNRLGISEHDFLNVLKYESVEDIAANNQYESPYIAIIAMDGDNMGKLMSGENAPAILNQMSSEAREYFEPIFVANNIDKDLKRPLSPSYHLQLSEVLANFANYIVDEVVRQFKGQLIYAGGDDVLAMLPADFAIDCAHTLRKLFRGEKPQKPIQNFTVRERGFINIGANYTLMMPGSTTDVSCGIAVAHKKYPLQKIITSARDAEKLAKQKYERSALAISITKRSGETLKWGAKWDSKAWEIYDKFIELSNDKKLSGRFSYALAQLLIPYQLDKTDADNRRTMPDNMREIMTTEFEHVMEYQGSKKYMKDFDVTGYLENLSDDKLEDFAALFLTATFLIRKHKEDRE